VNRAGHEITFVAVGVELLPRAEQQGRRERRPLRRDVLPQQLRAAAPDAGEPAPRGECAAGRQPLDRLGKLGEQPAELPFGPQVRRKIELARIERCGGAAGLGHDPQAVAGADAGQVAADLQLGPAAGRAEFAAVANGRDADD
jgi:hypothetical protein